MNEIIVKILYVYLFFLAMLNIFLSIKIGICVDKYRISYGKLYDSIILITILSMIQAFQSLNLILGPVTKTWWIPLACKQLSLYIYLGILIYARKFSKKLTQGEIHE